MDKIVEQAQAPHDQVAEQAQSPALTAGQRELVRRLEISWAQAERGELIPFEDVLDELRQEQEAEENANRNHA